MIPTVSGQGFKIAAAVGLLVSAFGAGAVVNGWRLNASFAEEKAELNTTINGLRQDIVTQNAAVDILDEKTKNAIERKRLAEKYSAELVNQINKRKAVIENSTATDCEGVLKEAHEDAR